MAGFKSNRGELSVRSIKMIWLIVLLGLVSACGTSGSTATETAEAEIVPAETEAAPQMAEIQLTMGFRPDIQFAPFYVAAENGYFADQMLDVEFVHLPENEAMQLLGAGELQFVIASGEQVLLGRQQELPVVYVMAWWQEYPVGIAVPADSDIREPADLAGHSIGLPGLYGASYIGLRALLNAAGLTEAEVTLDSIGYTQVESIYQGQEDAVVIYVNNEPVQLDAQGFPVRVLAVADYVHLISNGLVTNEETLENNPDLVRRMTTALLAGIRDTIADPEAAYEISTGYVEGLGQADHQVVMGILEESLNYWQTDRWGVSDAESWSNMMDLLLDMGLLSQPLDLSSAYSNAYLPE
jgi:NitT/TauT family transport system substrate-binding protein